MLTALLALAFAANDFVGAAECGKCHPAEFDRQRRSHHAAALAPISGSALAEKLTGHTVREKNGIAFNYRPAPGGVSVTVTRGRQQASAMLEWSFGAGAQGITAVGRIGDKYFEHRVSWYTRDAAAGLTIGHPADPPAGAAAFGQPQSGDTIYRCFHCHATGVESGPDLSGLRPGVECERCHGSGAAHASHPSAASILNPGRLSPQALVAACGECHRLPAPGANSAEPARANPESGRVAPIGHTGGRCFQESGKLACVTCQHPDD